MKDCFEKCDDLLKVELEHIGEGYQGDYDENDPEDAPLMRFTAYVRDPEDPDMDWEVVEDSSYCTYLSANDPEEKLQAAVEILFKRFRDAITEYPFEGSVKKLGEELSHINLNNVQVFQDLKETNDILNLSSLLEICRKKGYTADKLIQEAEMLDACGGYLHYSLMGFSPEMLRKAAEVLEKDEERDR